MRVSVIVPAYNSERYLPETIESVLKQTLRDWELIIVNDGSQDATEQIAQEYAQRDARIRFITRKNGGVAAARNTGFFSSCPETEFLCYLDHDDVWEPDALEVMTHALECHPEAVAVHGIPRAIDEHSRPVRIGELEAYALGRRAIEGRRVVDWPADRPTVFACFAHNNYIITPGLGMIRRSAQQRAGLWDENLNGVDDWDLWIRLCPFGDIVFLDRVVLNHRMHASNQSINTKLMEHGKRALLHKMLTTWEGAPDHREKFIWGYKLHAWDITQVRMCWARQCLQSGKFLGAMKQMRHALYHYCKYAFGPLHL